MKFYKGKLGFKVIAIALIVAITTGVIVKENIIKSKASEVDGDEYVSEEYANAAALAAEIELAEVESCTQFERSDGSLVVTSNRVDGSKIEAIYSEARIMKKFYNTDKENFFMEITELDQCTDDVFNTDMEVEVEEPSDEYDEVDDTRSGVVTRGKNGMRVFEWCNFRHWYQWRNSKKQLRIGCDASYNINYSKLSAAKKQNCKQYTSAIFNSNKMMAQAAASIACYLLGAAAAAPIVVTVLDLLSQGLSSKEVSKYVSKRYGAKLTGAAVATKLVGAIGAVISVHDFVVNRATVKSSYKIIRKFGKKIK